MKRILKIAGISLLLILIALIALPYVFKDRIIEEVKVLANENVRADLNFTDVGLSFFSNFPNLTLSIDDVVLTNQMPFEGVELVNAENLSATVNLASLFGDSIEVKSIEVLNPMIDVRVLEDGTANYDITIPVDSTTSDESTGEEESGGFNLALQQYTISGGQLNYTDETMPMEIHFTDLDHSGSGDFTEDEFLLKTKTAAASMDMEYEGVKYVSALPLDVEADLDIDLLNSKYSFGNNSMKAGEFPLRAEGYVAMPNDDIEMDITFDAPGSDFRHILSLIPATFAHHLDAIQTTGQVAFNGFIRGIYNETSMPGFGLELKVNDASLQYPDLPDSAEDILIDLVIDASQGLESDAMKIDLNAFHAEMSGNPIDAVLHLRTPYSDPSMDGALIGHVDLAKLSGVIPLDEGDELSGKITADVALKGKLSSIENERYDEFQAEGKILTEQLKYKGDSIGYAADIDRMELAFSPKYLALNEFDARMGESDVKATGRMDNYLSYFLKDEVLKGSFEVESDYLDLSEFMEEESSDANVETTSDSTAVIGVIDVPKNVDFLLRSTLDRIKYTDIDINNARGEIRVKDGTASVNNLTMEMLEGVVAMDGHYMVTDGQPHMDMDFDIRNMDIKQAAEKFYTIEKMAPLAKSCQGKFSTVLHMETALNDNMEPIDESLDASGRVQVKSVFIEKFEPLNKLAEELKIQRLAKQSFEDLNIGYKVQDGKVIIDPFEVKMDGIPATVEGYMTFKQELDYNIKLDLPVERLPGNIAQQAGGLLGQINEKLGSNLSTATSIPINLKVKGTVSKPSFFGSPGEAIAGQKEDLKEQVTEQIQEVVQDKIEEGKEAAVAKAQEEADKIMADAREQAEKTMAEATKLAEEVHEKAYAEAQKVEDSYKNPLEKAAKRLAANQIRKQADQAKTKALGKAREKSDGMVAAAQKKADAVITAAAEK